MRDWGVVPRVGIEPTLFSERDFESRASTNSATEAYQVEARVYNKISLKLSRQKMWRAASREQVER